MPFLRTLDAWVAAVNQGGRRKGAACVYLEPWHPDIEEFLELRDNTGEDARRTHNLNLANWIPDEFMRRVEADELWSLIDPDEVPELPDLWGEEFDAAYREAEAAGPLRAAGQGPRPVRQDDAHAGADRQRLDDVQGRLQRQVQPDRATPGNVVHLSNLCTEIIEVTSDGETAVCNLGSVNLGRATVEPADRQSTGSRLRATVRTAVPFLDRVIDINFYPSEQAAASNPRWRPVGLGRDGPAGRLLRAAAAVRLAPRRASCPTRIAEEIYLTALEASADLAERVRRRTRRSPDPGRRGATCSRTCGASRRRRPRAGRRCASGSPRPGCATRC